MGASERSKGQRGENELAALLSDELGISIKRMLGQERDGGADLHVGRLRIQVKRCETIKIAEWWRQACADAAGGIPVLAYRASRRPWTFMVALCDLLGEIYWDRSSCVEMPIGSFAFWVREKVHLNDQWPSMRGKLVKIRWIDPNHDWPYFIVMDSDEWRVNLKGADYPDGSARHDGGVFWADKSEISDFREVE